jgi:nuclear pore complex protein Nup93
MIETRSGGSHPGQTVSIASSSQVSPGPSSMDPVPLANKPILDKKACLC